MEEPVLAGGSATPFSRHPTKPTRITDQKSPAADQGLGAGFFAAFAGDAIPSSTVSAVSKASTPLSTRRCDPVATRDPMSHGPCLLLYPHVKVTPIADLSRANEPPANRQREDTRHTSPV